MYGYNHQASTISSPGMHPTKISIWVGNIPSNTTVMRLRDYFSEAMPSQYDLLSISYNPEARYAFINFRTDLARMSAIQRAASQLLDGKRLDCRIRQNGSGRSTKVNYGLESGQPSQPISISPVQSSSLWHKLEELSHFPEADSAQHGKEKYFILKSYSLETLYQSLGSGLWQVPNRHVERLNHAFQTASKVCLLFSVNGSGRFFGFATMRAEIAVAETRLAPATEAFPEDIYPPDMLESDSDSNSESPSRRQSLSSCDTSASAGSILYEPERRKITWHAPWAQESTRSRASSETLSPLPIATSNPFDLPSPDFLHSNLANFTQPCRIKWLSTQSVPFDEIRGLRNTWNNNKEIHVARNVTPVEPNAAAALLRHWQEKEQSARSGRQP
ncbi:hypothetical protein H2200_000571 [Cladophialophora chaetospira]|uniref:RRM domain-containing protein n=1 Tax=Cladophialophora chaetospira TaxID=386627 RepID=A0AA38XPI3_9EURO|nr:hypothetical protein H2200_000571 [Cladophialophora chaetospira]